MRREAMGVYSVFIYPDVGLTRAIETPKSPEVWFHDMITVALGDHGAINRDTSSRDAEGDGLP